MVKGLRGEDAPTGSGSELMGSGGREIRVAGAPEEPEVGVGESGVEEGKVG
jgi:hypothetical protein